MAAEEVGVPPIQSEFVAPEEAAAPPDDPTLGVDDAAKQVGFNPAGLPARDLGGTLNKLIWMATGLLAVVGLLAVALILAVLLLAWAVWKTRAKPAGAAV